MKKISLLILISMITSNNLFSTRGGAVGLQLGKITFGLGGSSNGPIIGIGPSPDNGLPLAVPIVPGDNYCEAQNCSNY